MILDCLAVKDMTYTLMQFHTHLGKHTGIEDAQFRNIPDGCGLYYGSDDELHKTALSSGTHWVQCTQQTGCLWPQRFLAWLLFLLSFWHLGSEDSRAAFQFLKLLFLFLTCSLDNDSLSQHCFLTRELKNMTYSCIRREMFLHLFIL